MTTDILGRYGPDNPRHEPLAALFRGMQLPLPEKNDTYCSTYGYLVFLSDFGIVLRFTTLTDIMKDESAHFIKPLIKREIGTMEFSIDPGLQCPFPGGEKATEDTFVRLQNKNGIVVNDRKAHNLALVPGTQYPVLIDLDPTFVRVSKCAVKTLSEKTLSVRQNIAGPKKYDVQEIIYAPLRKSLRKAWPENEPAPNPTRFAEFLDLCRTFKKDGKLLSPWDNQDNSYKNSTLKAENYTKKIHGQDKAMQSKFCPG